MAGSRQSEDRGKPIEEALPSDTMTSDDVDEMVCGFLAELESLSTGLVQPPKQDELPPAPCRNIDVLFMDAAGPVATPDDPPLFADLQARTNRTLLSSAVSALRRFARRGKPGK